MRDIKKDTLNFGQSNSSASVPGRNVPFMSMPHTAPVQPKIMRPANPDTSDALNRALAEVKQINAMLSGAKPMTPSVPTQRSYNYYFNQPV